MDKYIYSIIRYKKQVGSSNNLRKAKDNARAVGADFVVEFEMDLTLDLQDVHITRVFWYNPRIGMFQTYSYDEYLRLHNAAWFHRF